LDGFFLKWQKAIMDAVRKNLLETVESQGRDLKELSLMLGYNHAYLHQYIHRNSPKRLHADDRAQLSRILNIPETMLGAPEENAVPRLKLATPNATISNQVVGGGPLIPLYGTAVGGIYGQFELNGNRLDNVLAPASLLKVKDAYAVRIVGESMEPRYFDGETIFVNPNRRPMKGDYVVAQIKIELDGHPLAYVKRFVRWNSEKLVLFQHNPEEELEFSNGLVHSVHYILKNGE
jgi:phage repressor protein C with HTH and peptisase S24 domain